MWSLPFPSAFMISLINTLAISLPQSLHLEYHIPSSIWSSLVTEWRRILTVTRMLYFHTKKLAFVKIFATSPLRILEAGYSLRPILPGGLGLLHH